MFRCTTVSRKRETVFLFALFFRTRRQRRGMDRIRMAILLVVDIVVFLIV